MLKDAAKAGSANGSRRLRSTSRALDRACSQSPALEVRAILPLSYAEIENCPEHAAWQPHQPQGYTISCVPEDTDHCAEGSLRAGIPEGRACTAASQPRSTVPTASAEARPRELQEHSTYFAGPRRPARSGGCLQHLSGSTGISQPALRTPAAFPRTSAKCLRSDVFQSCGSRLAVPSSSA